jgi:hypothetical protein
VAVIEIGVNIAAIAVKRCIIWSKDISHQYTINNITTYLLRSSLLTRMKKETLTNTQSYSRVPRFVSTPQR